MTCREDVKGARVDLQIDVERLCHLADQGLNGSIIAQRLGVARNTVSKRLRDLGYVYRSGRWVRVR